MEKHNERERKKEGELGKSFIRSVWSSSKDVVVEMADIGVDFVTDSELLENIPVFGAFSKLCKAAYSLRDRLFLKKLQKFFEAVLSSASDEKKEEFRLFRNSRENRPSLGGLFNISNVLTRRGSEIRPVTTGIPGEPEFRRKMESDPDLQRNIGENIILLIERHDSYDKSSMLGKVFVGWINNKITYEQFYRIALVIDRAFIDDLVNLKRYYRAIEQYKIDESKSFQEYLDDATCQSLYSSQLVREVRKFTKGYTESIYYKSELGETLLRLLEEP